MFKPADPDAPLILVHIPKTAGTTLAIILINHFGQQATRGLDGTNRARDAFLAEPPAQRGAARLYIGHQAFGLHEHIPRRCTYVTMLRDPVSRLISHYHHMLDDPTHYLHRWTMREKLTLEQYIENPFGSLELDNGQTRMLANYRLGQAPPTSGKNRPMLESAVENLERCFCCVGLTERFDETMVLLADSLGWAGVPPYLPARVGRNRPGLSITEAVKNRIQERNALDCELYDLVRRRFEEQVRSRGEAFQERVRMVRQENESVAAKLAVAATQDAAAAPETAPA